MVEGPAISAARNKKVDPKMKQISNAETHANFVKNKSISKTTPQSGEAIRPGGKLGKIIKQLERTSGATIDALVKLTGWQKHSVHGALSKLRKRGFDIRFEAVSKNRMVYRLVQVEA